MIRSNTAIAWRASWVQCFAYICLAGLTLLLLSACKPVATPAADRMPSVANETAGSRSVEAAITDGAIAFVRDNTLYLQDYANDQLISLDQCTTPDCMILYPTWSPDGSLLLYYRGSWDSAAPQELRMADRSGKVQTITQGIGQYRPGAWSPSGDRIVYLVATDRVAQGDNAQMTMVMEVWTQAIEANGVPGNATKAGEIGFDVGCGGAGRSQAALVYEREGGFAFGYDAAVAIWTLNDLFLFSKRCDSRGVGRFDLNNGNELAPYPGDLRSLVISPDGTRWAAIDSNDQIVLGTPESTEFTPLTSQTQPELVFWGPTSGRLYYTSIEETGHEDLMARPDLLAKTPADVSVQWFDFTEPALHAFDAALNSEQTLYAGDDYAYARVTEAADGAVVFSAVESNVAMYNAIEQGIVTGENQADFEPGVDVVYLPPGATEPQVLVPDGSLFSLTQE